MDIQIRFEKAQRDKLSVTAQAKVTITIENATVNEIAAQGDLRMKVVETLMNIYSTNIIKDQDRALISLLRERDTK